MKRLISVFIAIALFFVSAILIFINVNNKAEEKFRETGKALNYNGGLMKINCPEVIGQALDANTIVMLGSSELPCYNEKSHPRIIMNNGNSDFNIMQIGAGYIQSLPHCINIGGIEPYIKNGKVVLNLSPQWFSATGLDPGAFSSRFSPRMLEAFMGNKKISKESKWKVLARCKELFVSYSYGLEFVKKYEKSLNGEQTRYTEFIADRVMKKFDRLKAEKALADALEFQINRKDETVSFEQIDFNELMAISEAQGQEECTNNPFYVYDEYYDEYLRPQIDELKGCNKNSSYCKSPEYSDLKLFLTICKELELEVMLINIPVNGYWYDYTGFPKKDRVDYYQNIRNIAEEYDVELLDLSMHEYTPYFLKDVMHLGWKGWVYIDEGIYEFYKKDIEP